MISEMVRIRNRERLEALTDMTIASGNAKRHEATRHINRLRGAGERTASAGELASLGIKVVTDG